jgi:hypothetical protein
LLGTAALALLLALAVIVALMAEAPKRRIIGAIAGQVLHADVAMSGLRLRPHIQLDSLRISDPGAEVPVLEAKDIVLHYRLTRPRPGVRLFSEMTVGEARLRLHETPEDSNFDCLTALLEKPETEKPTDPLPYIPQDVSVQRIGIDLQQPDTTLSLDGMAARVRMDDLENYTAALTAESLAGHLRSASPLVDERFTNGTLRGIVSTGGEGWHVDVEQLHLPGLVQARAAAMLYRDGDGTRVVASAPTISAGPLPVAPLFHFLGLPSARFDALQVEDVALDVRFGDAGWQINQARADAAFSQLEVGEPGARWYSGDLSLHVALQEGDEPAVLMQAVLAGGQEIEAVVGQEGNAFRGHAALTDWTKDDLVQATPEAYAPLFTHVTTLERLSAASEFYLHGDGYDATLTATAQLEESEAALDVAAKGTLPGEAGLTFQGTARATLADGSLSADITLQPDDALHARVVLETLRVEQWAKALWGRPLSELPSTTVSGTAEVRGSTEALAIALDLKAADLVWGALSFEKGVVLDVMGNLSVLTFERKLSADALTLTIGPEFTAVVTEAEMSLMDYAASANVTGKVDLAWAGAKLDQPDLWGEATFQLPLRNQEGYLRTAFHAEASSFGYGDLTIPYGSTLIADGQAVYDTLKGELRCEDLVATIGEGTRLTSPSWAVRVDPLTGEIPFQLTSDFVPVVAMGYLQEAVGTIEARGALHLGEAARIEADIEASAEHLTLPDALAFATDVTYTGHAGYGPALFGQGTVTTDAMVVAGAVIGDLSGPVRFEEDTVVATGLSGTLFNGPLEVDATAGVLQDKLPFTLDARGKQLDLALLTEQVKPPRVTLTGIADAAVHLELNDDGLQEVSVDAQSTSAFTVNRDIIQQVLLSQYMKDVTGGKQLDRIVQDVLGKSEQRPFESGNLDLDLVEGRLEGQALLKSEALNLTIDLQVDPQALIAAMQLTEQEALQDVEDVTTGPIEWGE